MTLTPASLLCAAIIVEGVITYVKTFFVDGKPQWQMLTAIALGVLVAIAYQLDVLALFGMVSSIPLLGCVLTGILLSRGANYVFDLVKLISSTIDRLRATDNVNEVNVEDHSTAT